MREIFINPLKTVKRLENREWAGKAGADRKPDEPQDPSDQRKYLVHPSSCPEFRFSKVLKSSFLPVYCDICMIEIDYPSCALPAFPQFLNSYLFVNLIIWIKLL